MRRAGTHSFDMEDGFEGAVDVVFLLIIFFLVASSFDRTVHEKLALPSRDAEQAVAPQKQKRERLDVVIYESSRITIDGTEVAIPDPNSVEAYRMVGDEVENWIEESFPGIGREKALTRMDVFITTDREAYAGAALNVIMACLDRGITPRVIFEESQVAQK